MAAHRPVSKRELGVLCTLIIPLCVVAVVIAHVPLDAYGSGDPRAFVARSLRIAHDWGSVTQIKDPPLRYVPLALAYTVAEPQLSPPIASAIGAAYGALAVFVVAPLAAWAFVRETVSPRAALLVLAGLAVDWLFEPLLWIDTTVAWQYYVALPWAFAALTTTHWTLGASDRQTRYQRAIVTGVLLGCLGLTQIFTAGIITAIVTVAFVLRRRVRALGVTGVAALPFAGYYLLSQAAREQFLGGMGRRSAPEALWPITLKELVFLAVLVALIAGWYRLRGHDRGVIGAALIVSGSVWGYAALLSDGYLGHFGPTLFAPLVLTGLVAVVEWTWLDVVSQPASSTQPVAHADGGAIGTLPLIERLSPRAFAVGVVVLALTLTLSLLATVPTYYPFWRL